MYRVQDAVNCLNDSVGFRQNTNPRYGNLDSVLVGSSTDTLIDHHLVTVENINQTIETSDADYYNEYDNVATYIIGDQIKVTTGASVVFYRSNANGNQGNVPPSAEWDIFDPVSDYLINVREDSIKQVLRDIYKKKKGEENIKNLFDNVLLFRQAGRITDLETKSSRFVGFEIQVKRSQYLTAVINQIGTQFSQVNGSFKLYLWHSSLEDPISITTIALSKSGSFEWSALTNTILSHFDAMHDVGGVFFIGYKESEILGQAIVKNQNFGTAPCSTCNQNEVHDWRMRSDHISIRSFSVPETQIVGNKLWDISSNRYPTNTNFGLNLDISIKCDVTDMFCREKDIFQDAIKLQMEMRIIEGLRDNTRNNEVAERIKHIAAFNLDSQENDESIPMEYKRCMESLDFDMSDLNSACLPCRNNSRVKYRSV